MKHTLRIICTVICTLILSAISVAAAEPYVAYWSFDTDAVEEINGYTPSNPEALTLAEGKNGKAYGGAGEDGLGSICYDDVDIPLTGNFTVSAWVKGDFDVENGSYFVFMAKNAKSTDGHFELYWFPAGTLGAYATNADEACNLQSDAPFDDAAWHHLCVRAENGVYTMYVDGAVSHTFEGTALNRAAGTLAFGSLADGSLPCRSYVDDMFMTDTLIPEADVAKLMEDTKTYAYTLSGKTSVSAEAEKPEANEAPAEAETLVKTEADPVPVAAPQTADGGILPAVGAILSFAAVIHSRKKYR